MPVAYCPSCGNPLLVDRQEFCSACGTDLRAIHAADRGPRLGPTTSATGHAGPLPRAGVAVSNVMMSLRASPTPTALIAAGIAAAVALASTALPWVTALGLLSVSALSGNGLTLIPPIVALILVFVLRSSLPASMTKGRLYGLRISFAIGVGLALIVIVQLFQTQTTILGTYRLSDYASPGAGLWLYLLSSAAGLVGSFMLHEDATLADDADQMAPDLPGINVVGRWLVAESNVEKIGTGTIVQLGYDGDDLVIAQSQPDLAVVVLTDPSLERCDQTFIRVRGGSGSAFALDWVDGPQARKTETTLQSAGVL